MFGPVMSKKLLAAGFEAKIVGNKALALLAQKLFDDRMAAADDEQLAGSVEFRARVAAVRGQLCERSEHVELRDGRGGAPQAPLACAAIPSAPRRKLALDFEDALVGGENFALVFLQLGRGEALGIHQRLLALVVRGREMQIGLRNLDVVAEDLVEANLQRGDAGAFALALFHRGDDLLAVLAEVAQFVEFGVVTAADHARVGGERRRLVGDGAFEPLAHVGKFVDLPWRSRSSSLPPMRGGVRKFFSTGSCASDLRSATSSRGVARPSVMRLVRRSRSWMPRSSLRISPRTTVCCDEMRHGVEARLDGVAVDQRAQHPGAQQTRAHAGDGGVQRGDQSRGSAARLLSSVKIGASSSRLRTETGSRTSASCCS